METLFQKIWWWSWGWGWRHGSALRALPFFQGNWVQFPASILWFEITNDSSSGWSDALFCPLKAQLVHIHKGKNTHMHKVTTKAKGRGKEDTNINVCLPRAHTCTLTRMCTHPDNVQSTRTDTQRNLLILKPGVEKGMTAVWQWVWAVSVINYTELDARKWLRC